MIFGPVPLDQALGCILAHTHRLPTRVIRKGAILDAEAIEALRAATRDPVIAATLEPGDIPEDEAATLLAEALLTPGLDRSRPGTGRVNLIAHHAGLLRIEATSVNTLNATHEALTLATLPDWASVAPGDMVATIKIIPFAVPGPTLSQALKAVTLTTIRLHPYRHHHVGLVMTTLPGLKPSILEGTAEATANRITALGGTLLAPTETPHDTQAIATALKTLIDQGAEILLVAGASAVVDRRDIGPAAIVAAGGEIRHFGMPVDPGNLICLGRIGTRPALVLPGCARSPKLNGIDWVLQRLFARIEVDGPAIAAMGVGGLLTDVIPRPLPRAKAAPPRPRIATIVLAAGRSSRMAPGHKLLIPGRDGRPMIARVVDNLLAAPGRPLIVVTGHRAPEITAALQGRPIHLVHAEHHATGLSASLRAALAAVPPEAQAAIVCLGDMPLVTARTLERLVAAYDPEHGRLIIAPTHEGEIGNPVLWDRRFFPEMMALTGDRGARALLESYTDQVHLVPLDDDAVIRDVDTPEQLAALPSHMQPA